MVVLRIRESTSEGIPASSWVPHLRKMHLDKVLMHLERAPAPTLIDRHALFWSLSWVPKAEYRGSKFHVSRVYSPL